MNVNGFNGHSGSNRAESPRRGSVHIDLPTAFVETLPRPWYNGTIPLGSPLTQQSLSGLVLTPGQQVWVTDGEQRVCCVLVVAEVTRGRLAGMRCLRAEPMWGTLEDLVVGS